MTYECVSNRRVGRPEKSPHSRWPSTACLCLVALFAIAPPALADKPRARDLGIPFNGTPGHNNAITDVVGVTVGFTTIIADLPQGKAVRTGVTAILPRGRDTLDHPVFAGLFSLNGNGEMTGSHWVEESGFLEGPVMLTNTHSVGVVRDATIASRLASSSRSPSSRSARWRSATRDSSALTDSSSSSSSLVASTR